MKALKDDLIKLDREIQLSLKPIEESEGQESTSLDNGVGGISAKQEAVYNQETQIPGTLKDVKEIMGDRLVIASVGNSPPVEKKEGKSFKL